MPCLIGRIPDIQSSSLKRKSYRNKSLDLGCFNMNKIDTNPLSNIVQQFNSDLAHQISNAAFTNALLLPDEQDFMDPEKVCDNCYLFDTTAYTGKIATLVIDGIELIVAYVQVIRLTVSCSSDTLSSMVLDEQCFDDLSDSREWIVLAKILQHQSNALYGLNHSNVYEINNQPWVKVELHIQSPLNEQLNELIDQIDFINEAEISELIEASQHRIFEKCKHTLQETIPTLD